VPFYLERILGRTPAEAGLLLSPVPIGLGVMAPLAGVLTDRFGSRLPTVTGMLLSAAALFALALLPDAALPEVLALLLVLGVGLGLFTPPNNSAIMGSAPQRQLGVAGGILNMTRSIGTSLGVALTGAILALLLSAYTGAHVTSTVDADPAALEVAFHQTLLCLGVLAAATGLLSAVRGAPTLESVPTQQAAIVESVGL
jgi:MFS family permease